MCDTFVVMPDVSALHAAVLCKNSDRPAFDCQPLAVHGRKSFPEGEKLPLAYVTIDQVPERFASVGSSPYWCWGYEEGINEFGVAIGNEAVYTRDLAVNRTAEEQGNPVPKGILGMELLRLGLERGKTAGEALRVMTALVERYGQWGSGVPMSDTISGSYNNSYIIADSGEAWILETAGKQWAARKLESGCAAISNELTIRTDMTCGSADLQENAEKQGWRKKNSLLPFDFADTYIAHDTARQVSHIRVQRVRSLLKEAVEKNGEVTDRDMRRILRDHYEGTFLEGPYFNPSDPDFLTVCMHQSTADFTWGNTASSVVTVLPRGEESLPVMWWGACVPCCSVYLPIYVGAGDVPECLKKAGTYGKTFCPPSEVKAEDTCQEGSFWWEMRSLLDLVNGDERGHSYAERHGAVRDAFDRLEEKWFGEAEQVQAEAIGIRKTRGQQAMADYLYRYTEQCTAEAMETIHSLKKLCR